jgi:hypothetical protein
LKASHVEIIKAAQSFVHPLGLTSIMPETKKPTKSLMQRTLHAAPGALLGGYLGHRMIGGPLAIAGSGLLGGLASTAFFDKGASLVSVVRGLQSQ